MPPSKAKDASDKLRQAILDATLQSVQARNLYSEQVAYDVTGSLADAKEQVVRSILGFKPLKKLPDNRAAALAGMKALEAEIGEVMAQLQRDTTLRFRSASKEAAFQGVYSSIEDLTRAQLPFYADLTPKGIDKLASTAFTIMDTDALDFAANYTLQLAGDVNAETKAGIYRTIRAAIATGRGPDDIVADLGEVIKDPESFRHAGSKVFSKAQYRMEVIARTEVLRAHQQGKKKFHQAVGISLLEWFTMEDERVCRQCGPLNGKTFSPEELPNQPLHPNCRCTHIPSWPLVVCGAGLLAEPLPGEPAPSSLLVPDLGKPTTPTVSPAAQPEQPVVVEEPVAKPKAPKKSMKKAPAAAPAVPAEIAPTKGVVELPEFMMQGMSEFQQVVASQPQIQAGMKKWAKKRGMTVAQYQAAVEAHLAQLADEAEVCVDCYSPTLAKILSSGAVKNQFETNTSTMVFSHDIRGQMEFSVFGIPLGAPGKDHPVYGWIGENPHQWSDNMEENGAYGDVTLVLKKAVKKRTTMVGDDSLGIAGWKNMSASPMTAPHWTSVYMTSDGDPLDLKRLGDPKSVTGAIFTEAQVHGGVTLADIDRVVVSKHTPKSTLDKLTEAGIPWEYRKVDYFVDEDMVK